MMPNTVSKANAPRLPKAAFCPWVNCGRFTDDIIIASTVVPIAPKTYWPVLYSALASLRSGLAIFFKP